LLCANTLSDTRQERMAWQEGAMRYQQRNQLYVSRKCYQTYHAMGGTVQ
jgi:hypothetical protein